MCVLGPQRDQNQELDPLELDLGVVVSHHMGIKLRDSGPLQEQPVLMATEPPLISF